MRTLSLSVLFVLLLGGAWSPAAEPSPEAVEFFEKKIRPILVEHCFTCHTGDKVKGGLRLDSRAAMLAGGDSGPALVPGDPDKSLLIRAIRYGDDLRMPPRSKLQHAFIADLTTWVKMGAPWPEFNRSPTGNAVIETFHLEQRKNKHWAWQPLPQVVPPVIRDRWIQSPIDAFILARLRAAGLKPAAPADRRTLVRRVTWDLIGLPPTPEEVAAALHDDSPDWFAKVVERLLSSPHYGERWARHWLDLVRYAETYGHEYDFDIPSAHVYRDYVIRAFNADVPYDQFVIEHIAGDLLPHPRRHPIEGYNESIIGTGFWFLGEAKHSPVDSRADETDRLDNQLDVFAKTFLGLTLSCARCHDHKFDAISTKDYYALMGYLESSRYQHAFIDMPDQRAAWLDQLQELQSQLRRLAVGSTVRAMTEKAQHLARYLMVGQRGGGEVKMDNLVRDRWTRALARSAGRTDNFFYPWLVLSPLTSEEQFTAARRGILSSLKAQAGRAAEVEQKAVVFADFSRHTFKDWFVTGEAFGNGPVRTPIPVFSSESPGVVKQVIPPGIAHSGLLSPRLQGVLRSPTFTIEKKKILFHVAGKDARINLILDGLQLIHHPIYGNLTFKVDQGDAPTWHVMDVGMWIGHKAYIEVIDDGPGYVAIDKILFADDSTLPPKGGPNYLLLQLLDDPDLTTPEALAEKYQEVVLDLLQKWRQGQLGRHDLDRVELLNALLASEALAALPSAEQPPLAEVAALQDRLRQVEAALPPPRRALAIMDGTPRDVPIHIRGHHKNLGEVVPRRFLEALGSKPVSSNGSGRLDLARQVVDPANPLTARVLVNRLWKHHFGEGIVRSVDNFGVLGDLPTHPELLDWLASEFVRRGWSIKEMHRLLVLSSTYQMSSQTDDSQAAEKDPQNKLLHRMAIRRLEAEAIRDAILAVSGRLDKRLYGPSVLPHLTPHMSGRGRPAQSGPLDGDGRRSIYINVRRNFLTPMFLAFDYPIPFTTIGKRTVSNVPAQALALLNNPLVVQQAERWARQVLADPNRNPEQRISQLYLEAFARPPEPSEQSDALLFLQEQGKRYAGVNDVRTWADLCHVLFNVKEFIFIN